MRPCVVLAALLTFILVIPLQSEEGSFRTPWLDADVYTLSESTGGVVNFYLFGGPPNGGRSYLLLGSVSGTTPGIPLPGGTTVLPLNWDFFTELVILYANTPIFQQFRGNLTWGSSTAWATLDTHGPLPSGSAGMALDFAFLLYPPFDFASNPLKIDIVP